MSKTLTTKEARRDGYDFSRDGSTTWVGDSHHDGTDIFWSERFDRWVFADHESGKIDYADRIAAVRLGEGCDPDEGLNQAMLACDLDGPGLWIVDAGYLEEIKPGYVDIIFREVEKCTELTK